MDETPARRSRRKACDLCFKKKIKCDRITPRCSHCKIYKAATCTYTPMTRPHNAKTISSSRADVLEARLNELEARLKEVERVKDADQSRPILPTSEETGVVVAGTGPTLDDLLTLNLGSPTDPTGSEASSGRSEGYSLPPLRDILPTVSEYFATSNRVVPLFHEPTFMRMLRNWYITSTSQQDPATWAAINIVLALSRRHTYLDFSASWGTPDLFVRNAQSVLDLLVTRDQDLLGIQVVLGLTLIFYGTSDPKPTTVLIATAVRLAHTLRLSTRKGMGGMDPDTVLQRCRIFWILYIYDRDVALRIRQPAMLNEFDIDLELPEENPPDGVGVLHADNGTRINYFRKRVQFAWIQGKVYDWLFSVRAEKMPPATKAEHTRRLEQAMDQWYASLPVEFTPDSLSSTSDSTTFRTFLIMHFTRLQVLAVIHHSYAYDAQWLETLRSFSKTTLSETQHRASLPGSFEVLVQRSRENLKLFGYLPHQDLYILWSVCCSFFSSVIFLIVNNLANPRHGFVDQDQKMIDSALQIIARLDHETNYKTVGKMRGAMVDLDSKARVIVERAQSRQLLGQFDDAFAFAEQTPALEAQVGGDQSSLFTEGSDSNITGLGADFFGGWLGGEFLDGGIPVESGPPLRKDEHGPTFDTVVTELLRQRWF